MPIAPPPRALTTRLSLRLVNRSDASATAALMTADVAGGLSSWRSPMSVEQALERIGSARARATAGIAIDFAIRRRLDNRLLGWVGLAITDEARLRGKLGYWIGTVFQGQRYMSEAASAALGAGAEFLGLRVVEASAKIENAASIGVLRKLEFRHVGFRQETMISRGTEEPCAVYERTWP